MAAWTQSHFLQALGWATLNSLWQMALLWGLFAGVNYACKLSACRKYVASVSAMFIGFAWFIITAVFYYQDKSSTYAFFENTITHSNRLLHICLLSASVTYIVLLIFPAIRLLNNWKFVQRIKGEGHQKPQLEYRLFVQKVSFLLGITKKVKIAVSSLVTSPVTVGYLKPVILLPVAVMNNLSPTQVEAILLHELSHIRRYDYLLNLIVSIIHTLLYFNPFAKSFMNTIEAEREACCDELVLQFGYDKVDYASALLHLEKASGRHHALALAAAGKQNLLTRIEKIVGMEKKKNTFKLIQIVPLFLSMFCILLFNSVLIIHDAGTGEAMTYSNDTVLTPWQLESSSRKKMNKEQAPLPEQFVPKSFVAAITSANNVKVEVFTINSQPTMLTSVSPVMDHIIPVGYDEVDASLTLEEKEKVKSTVEATKKVASTLQWKEIEASIGDAMNQKEKAIARQEYMHELDKVAWTNIEQNLKANYDKLDWQAIETNVAKALSQVQLDSIQTVYAQALTELEKAEKHLREEKAKCSTSPMPDASVEQIQMAQQTLKKNLEELKALGKPKKVIKL